MRDYQLINTTLDSSIAASGYIPQLNNLMSATYRSKIKIGSKNRECKPPSNFPANITAGLCTKQTTDLLQPDQKACVFQIENKWSKL